MVKKWQFIFLFLFPAILKSQTIITVAGGGSGGDGSPAISAGISDPTWLAFDKQGNIYISEGLGNRVRKITAATGIITTFSGTGSSAYNGDGGLADTTNMSVGSCVFDTGYNFLYIPDGHNYRVRKVNITTNIVTTADGNGVAGFGGDGNPATSAMLQPNDICFDKFGNTFIIDVGNYRIRKVNPLGIISTYAGTGISGWNASSGPATSIELGLPRGITTDDSGNLYIADEGSVDNCIWKVNTTGIITTFAGNHTIYAYNGDNMPATAAAISPVRVVYHSHNIYIADFYNNRIRVVDTAGIIHTVAGNGSVGFSGDGGSADSAKLNGPSGIAFDTCDNLYITQVNDGRIRKVIFDSTCSFGALYTPETITNTYITTYPNPCESELHIDNIQTSAEYVLSNITGVVQQKGKLKQGSNTVSLSALPRGLYLLELTDEQGRKTVKKVRKE